MFVKQKFCFSYQTYSFHPELSTKSFSNSFHIKLTLSLHCILLTVEHSWWMQRYHKYHRTMNEHEQFYTVQKRHLLSWLSTHLFHHCVTSGLHVWTALLHHGIVVKIDFVAHWIFQCMAWVGQCGYDIIYNLKIRIQ